MVRTAIAVLLTAALAGAAAGGEAPGGREGALALWESFREHLRRGNYAAAHDCFSPASRAVFSPADFYRDYQPAGVACPLILAEPVDMRLRIDGDWAELRLTVRKADGNPAALRAALVREDGNWRLAAGIREKEERWESDIRGWLASAAADAGPHPADRMKWLEARRGQAPAAAAFYRFERRRDQILAVSSRDGLRSFRLEADGRIGVDIPRGRNAPPAPAIPSSAPASAPAPRAPIMAAAAENDAAFYPKTPDAPGISAPWAPAPLEPRPASTALAPVGRGGAGDETSAGAFPAAMRPAAE